MIIAQSDVSSSVVFSMQLAAYGDPLLALQWVQQQMFLPDIVFTGETRTSSEATCRQLVCAPCQDECIITTCCC